MQESPADSPSKSPRWALWGAACGAVAILVAVSVRALLGYRTDWSQAVPALLILSIVAGVAARSRNREP